jgi:hypothetical protein
MSVSDYSSEKFHEFINTLKATPSELLKQSKFISEEQSILKPSPKEWCYKEVVVHMLSCSSLWSNSIHLMLSLNNPVITFVHPNKYYPKTGWLSLKITDLIKLYTLNRKEFIYSIEGLSLKKIERTGIIKERTHSVYSQVRRMALHELNHKNQLQRTAENART